MPGSDGTIISSTTIFGACADAWAANVAAAAAASHEIERIDVHPSFRYCACPAPFGHLSFAAGRRAHRPAGTVDGSFGLLRAEGAAIPPLIRTYPSRVCGSLRPRMEDATSVRSTCVVPPAIANMRASRT